MYGLILENVLGYLRSHFHPHRYEEIKASAKLPFDDPIDLFKVYPEGAIQKIGKKASLHLQISEKEIFEGVGVYFVSYYKKLGYRQTVARIGRYYREFLLNLDNCHDYFKLTFTHMRAPSFFVEQEHANGLTVIYRSKRRGFTYYVLGQLKEIARTVFDLKLKIDVKKQEIVFDTVVVSYTLEFDNSAYIQQQEIAMLRLESSMPVRARIIFNELFPFGILFDHSLVITLVGVSLRMVLPKLIGQSMNSCFQLIRPLIEFSADQIMQRTNNVFVFQSLVPVSKIFRARKINLSEISQIKRQNSEDSLDDGGLLLRGSMVYMADWRKIFFLGCPIIDCILDLVENGLFINDLSIHDHSRDIVITYTQTLFEERMMKLQNKLAAKLLDDMDKQHEVLKEENKRKLESWIPPQVLVGLPENPENRVSKLDFTAMLVASIDRFDMLSSRADPIDLIELLDDASAIVDHLSQTIGALRVETEKDFLVMSDFTACLSEETQVVRMATMALDLENAARSALREPVGKRNKPVKFRIALVTGPVVYAVIGSVLPKFCVLGPTINMGERLMELCPPDKIIAQEDLIFKLPPEFKTTKVSSAERVKLGLKSARNGQPAMDVTCIYIEGKQDHKHVPVLHIVQAYGAFKVKSKANKRRALLAGGGGKGDSNTEVQENGKGKSEKNGGHKGKTNGVTQNGKKTNGKAEDEEDICNGFLKSKACIIV